MTLATRLRAWRKHQGMTQSQVANAAGMSQQSFQKIEDGQTKNPRRIIQIARYLKCNPEWLLFGVGDCKSILSGAEGYYPLINWFQANNLENISESELYVTERYQCPVNCGEKVFVLKVQGIGMTPDFKDGELIFVDPEREWVNGSYVVVKRNNKNEAIFKQLIIEEGITFLRPSNPNWPEQVIPFDKNYSIVGTVIFSGRPF